MDSLTALRRLLKERNLMAYIIPTNDAHESEYVAEVDARRAFISGFTGSAGTAVVTLDSAALWTDGRYFLQASKQLDSNWVLQKMGLPSTPSITDWLKSKTGNVGIDPKLFSKASFDSMTTSLAGSTASLVLVQENLVDTIWANQPPRPQNPITVLDLKFSGCKYQDKLQEIRSSLIKGGHWGVILTALDDIAWIFNLRGSDIKCNPVFFAYALITLDDATLYTEGTKVTAAVEAHLKGNVRLRPYDAIFSDLSSFTSIRAQSSETLLVDRRCNYALVQSFGAAPIVFGSALVEHAKAIKNETEIQGFRNCHIRDAVALVRYFCWLEHELVVKKVTNLDEATAADRLEKYRSELDLFVGLSFDTISSTGSNGAIIHYKPEHGKCANIDVNKIYLCDSGAQFLDGTTDTTRTMHFGTPTAEEKDAFTRVLKGHIQVDRLVIPEGTTGYVLNSISRLALWKAGLDFQHGTGHGVGSYLNVHEGPHGIGSRPSNDTAGFKAGMTITDEPGYYKDGHYGIRIENILVVKKAKTAHNFNNQQFLDFEHVTVVPIQTKLINVELLDQEELQWINSYNQECFDKVSPLLDREEMAYKWLFQETRPIGI